MGLKTIIFAAACCAVVHLGHGQYKGGQEQQQEQEQTENMLFTRLRICVPENVMSSCLEMLEAVNGLGKVNLNCVSGRDKLDCIHKIAKEKADFALLDPEDIYVAGKLYGEDLVVIQQIRSMAGANDDYRYGAVALIKNSGEVHNLNDLRGKKSCHTGYDRTAGWRVPISQLMHDGIIPLNCDASKSTLENEISSVAQFFGPSCVPFIWGNDEDVSKKLKREYHSLCDLCSHPETCDGDDVYAGYEGTIRCLTQGDGDVAWTKMSAVQSVLKYENAQDFSLLCPNGQLMPVTSNEPCTWAGRPWSAFVMRNEADPIHGIEIKRQLRQLKYLSLNNDWLSKVLGMGKRDFQYNMPFPVSVSSYIDHSNYNVTIDRPSCSQDKLIRWCVVGNEQEAKCLEFATAAHSRRIRPGIACVKAESRDQCAAMINRGEADIMVRYSKEVYSDEDFIPVVSLTVEGTSPYRYYSVAVVKADSGIHNVEDLRGKRSCHSGFKCHAGFLFPAHVLAKKQLIYPFDCDYATAMSHFFAGGSCAPGAKDSKNDPQGTNPEGLCSICVGEDVDVVETSRGPQYTRNGASKCSTTDHEAFYGYDGAFRCLASGHGDVAFTKHLVVESNTDGHSEAPWASQLKSSDFRLLCKEGGLRPVEEYKQCNWGKVPGSKIVTSIKKSSVAVEDIREALLNINDVFGGEDGEQNFHLFTPYEAEGNFLSDTVAHIVPIEPVETDYLTMLKRVRDCQAGPNSLTLIQCAQLFTTVAQKPQDYCKEN